MKFKSKVIVLAVVICILFGISTVCASDNNTDTVSIGDNINNIDYQKVDVSNIRTKQLVYCQVQG